MLEWLRKSNVLDEFFHSWNYVIVIVVVVVVIVVVVIVEVV